MTEALWQDADHPSLLIRILSNLGHLDRPHAPRARKLRLFACTCCRRVWSLLGESSRRAVEIAERYSDGLATERELRRAHESGYQSFSGLDPGGPYLPAANAAHWVCVPGSTPTNVAGMALYATSQTILAEERARQAGLAGLAFSLEKPIPWQCRLLRDLFGNPYQRPVLEPSWREYDNRLVVSLARGIYEDNAFERLPILGDALEEAGCTDEAILRHCRSGGVHFRGCWVVDLCLGNVGG